MEQPLSPESQAVETNLPPASGLEQVQEGARGKLISQIGLSDDQKPSPNVKKAFPLFGNHLFQVTGPVNSSERMKELRENPELLELMLSQRQSILDFIGVDSFSEIKNQYGNVELTKKVRDHITQTLRPQFMTTAKKALIERLDDPESLRLAYEDLDEVVAGELDHLSKEADEIIEAVVGKFFPETGSNPPLGMLNEVTNKHDVATSVMMTFDEKMPPRARYEALRRLALMEILFSLGEFEDERREEDRGLSYLDDILTEEGVYATGDYKIAIPENEYMVTEHDPTNNKCVGYSLIGDKEKADTLGAMDENRHVTTMAFRHFNVEDESGNPKEIRGLVDSRIKDRLAMALKMLRKNSNDAAEVLSDLNGVRMVFETEEDIEMFEKSLLKILRASGHEVEITRTKEAIGKGKLAFKKHNISINGRKYELQIFTLKEFADYLYRRPNSWSEYEVKRFFESSSSEALFPSDIYGDLDRKKLAEEAQDEAYRRSASKLWGAKPLRDDLETATG